MHHGIDATAAAVAAAAEAAAAFVASAAAAAATGQRAPAFGVPVTGATGFGGFLGVTHQLIYAPGFPPPWGR